MTFEDIVVILFYAFGLFLIYMTGVGLVRLFSDILSFVL